MKQKARIPWTPFERCDLPSGTLHDAIGKPRTIWKNSRYQVAVYEKDDSPMGPITHLSIKRIDKEPIHDWRDLQRIKNELCGRDREGFELYPSEARLTDTANQYHIFVLPAGNVMPVGFFDGRVVAEGGGWGAKQRPFEEDNRPDDLLTLPESPDRIAEMAPELKRRKEAMLATFDEQSGKLAASAPSVRDTTGPARRWESES